MKRCAIFIAMLCMSSFYLHANTLKDMLHTHADTILEQLTQKHPHDQQLWLQCGLYWDSVGIFAVAHRAFEHILTIWPHNTKVRNKLIQHALRAQDWHTAHALGLQQYWWYNYDIHNKHVHISYDGGFGDVVQFLRYAKHLHTAGAHVTVAVPRALMDLFALVPYIDTLVPAGTPVDADYTFRISIPELTLTMSDSLHEPSHDVPYLYAQPALVQQWHDFFAEQDKRVNIGLCWHCSTVIDRATGQEVPNPRSIPLRTYAPLFTIPNCSFYSVQHGPGTEESASSGLPIYTFTNLDTTNGRFMDTVAILRNLDLLITADTSLAHIAGALGVPVWVLIPACSDFRWFTNTDTSPWYPTMRIFRQQVNGTWDQVVNQVYTALKILASR